MEIKFLLTPLAAISCLAMVSSAAYSEKKPEINVDALVGTTIPARSASRTGDLNGWHERGGTLLGHSELGLGLSEYYRDGQAIFIITRTDSKLNKTILDVRKLPMNIMDHKIVGNKLVFLKNAVNRYGLAHYCASNKETEAIVIGLAKPEKRFKDCSHRTRQIYTAWIVDTTTGKLKTINPKGVTCLLSDFEDSCEHQQSGME